MENAFPEHLIDEVKERNEIVDVISSYVHVKSTGHSYKALCPFHNEKTPSFVISRDKQIFKCFGCGEAGDVLNFVMKIENLEFIDAVKFLAERVNMKIETEQLNKQGSEANNRKNKLYEISKVAAKFFYNNLKERGNPALKYLINRGFSIQTISHFGLGYASNSWNLLLEYLTKTGYTEDELEKCGLIVRNKNNGFYDRFRNRVMFPIFDVRGNVVAFGGRVLDDSLPKYLNSPETDIFNKRKILYNLNSARKHVKNNQIIVVEGYTDVISLYQLGIKNTVATLGTSFTKEHGNILKRYCQEVVICFDGDVAGTTATSRGIDLLKEIDINLKVVLLPDKKDPDEYVKQYGKIAFEDLINQAMTLIDYKIHLVKQKYNLNVPEEKIKIGKEVVKIIKEIESSIEKEVYINKICQEIGISIDALNHELYGNKAIFNPNHDKKYSYSNKRNNNKYIESVPIPEQKGHIIAEKQLVKYMLTYPNAIIDIAKKINSDDFLLAEHQAIVEIIYESQDFERIKQNLTEYTDLIKNILETDISHIDMNKALEQYVLNLRRYKLLYELNILQDRQKEISNDINLRKEEVDSKLLEISIKIMDINREVQKLRS
ncbi:DNA primase [Serpentinicella alkaliphila]|uniref:DNA primase n=1 Tax=Serpentinicella alkaliphila TaxID=1734049 RepID=A0A4R2TXU4_9FIRM|nr:DNA primase [Serpentinicella alkaliphila]QUH26839.1 DNA primase [Serpentinicella alkaliphila]TCQ08066.1 DNA primase [Serpentinicella alkaliphila]